MNGTPPWVLLTVATIGAVASLIVAILTVREQREKHRAEHGVEMSVERAIRHFLSVSELRYRSFYMIRHHIGGFEANQLRQLLVRSGAVRFIAADGTELWALISRVEDDFKFGRGRHPDVPLNKVSEGELFPGAFQDTSQY